MAFVDEDERKMRILQQIFESNIFWNYIVANSKPYSFGYYSLNGSNIKNFGISIFTEKDTIMFVSMTAYTIASFS